MSSSMGSLGFKSLCHVLSCSFISAVGFWPYRVVREEFPYPDDVVIVTVCFCYRFVEGAIKCPFYILLGCINHDGRVENGLGIALCDWVERPVGLTMEPRIGEVDPRRLSCERINFLLIDHTLISMIL